MGIGFDLATTGMAVVNDDGAFVAVNDALCELLARTRADVSTSTWRQLVVPDDYDRAAALAGDVVRGRVDTGQVEVRYLRGDRTVVWADVHLRRLPGDDQLVLIQVVDLTAHKALETDLRRRALHDPLTDLPNRVLLADRLDHALRHASRDGSWIGVAFADLDGFKLINDRHGHRSGDLVLLATARRLLEAMRAEDTVARYGGDEFVLVIEDLPSPDAAEPIVRRALNAVNQPTRIDGGIEVAVAASAGLVIAPGGHFEADQLLQLADIAMYDAKNTATGLVVHTLSRPT